MADTVEGLVKRLRDASDGWSGNAWAVDAGTADEAASALEALVVERDERQPHFEGVAKHKLDDLISPERGWNICGYAIEKNGEYGLVTTGGFVGWWTVASNNADAADARALAAEAQRDKAIAALKAIAEEADLALDDGGFGIHRSDIQEIGRHARSTLNEIAP